MRVLLALILALVASGCVTIRRTDQTEAHLDWKAAPGKDHAQMYRESNACLSSSQIGAQAYRRAVERTGARERLYMQCMQSQGHELVEIPAQPLAKE
jgi:uncharacterized protein YceK